MADITWADVAAFAPNVSTFAAGAQTDVLAYVNTELDSSGFGGDDSPGYRIARIYLAAHFATASQAGAAIAGTYGVASESAGGLSISYGGSAFSLSASALGSTPYGTLYLGLLNQSAFRAPVVV